MLPVQVLRNAKKLLFTLFIICLKVWPLAGPLAGGTEIEIHGSDLGKSFDDIRESVSVSDLKCHPDQGKYEPSRR